MKFLSLCSGIEAASQAWNPLGWEAVGFSEIEPFPCAVLAHRYPNIPNFGNLTNYHEWTDISPFDLLAAGTPCQGWSLAGLRKGLADPRSRLSLVFVEVAAKYRPRWLVWENVPGVLSSEGGADFATLLAALTGREIQTPDGGWRNSGHVEGIPEAYGIAWRVLDAQFIGVPQRRRRVFLVGHLGDWRRAAAVLFERESLCGNPPPGRKAGQGVAGTLNARSKSGGGFGTDFDIGGGIVAPTLDAGYGRTQGCSGQDMGHGHGHLIADTVTAKWAKGSGGPSGDECQNLIAHALTGEGFDASEDGTGRGTPLVPVHAIQAGAVRENPSSGPDGIGVQSDIAYTLEARSEVQVVAFDCKASGHSGNIDGRIAPTLRAMGEKDTHANAGGQIAIAFAENVRGEIRVVGEDGSVAGALSTGGGKPGQGCPAIAFQPGNLSRQAGADPSEEIFPTLQADSHGDQHPHVAQHLAVRRLTPRECERLQGFPDDFTRIPYRGKPAELCPDGPRYKALGNSWAVPCATWIGRRIEMVERIPDESL